MNLHLQLAAVTWFSLWSAGSPSPLHTAGPQWPAREGKQDSSAWAAHVSLNHTSSTALPHIHLSATLVMERRWLFGCKEKVNSSLIWHISDFLFVLSIHWEQKGWDVKLSDSAPKLTETAQSIILCFFMSFCLYSRLKSLTLQMFDKCYCSSKHLAEVCVLGLSYCSCHTIWRGYKGLRFL